MSLRTVLTRVYTFSAAHRLHSQHLYEGANRQVYDKCNNLYGHGHDYTLEVSVAGSPHPLTGFVLPLRDLDQAVHKILARLDYRYLDKEVEYFTSVISTGENIIGYLWDELQRQLPPNMLYHLKLWETNNNYFEIGKEL